MLGYLYTGQGILTCLKGFPLVKQQLTLGTVYRLKGNGELNPKELKLIPAFDDPNLKLFKITETLNPEYLAKKEQIGKPINLISTTWKVPVLRKFQDGTELPERLVLTESGLKYQVRDDHFKAWAWGESILKWYDNLEEGTTDQVLEAIVDILKINYHITKYDLLVYGELDRSATARLLKHAVDWQTRLDFLNSMSDDLKKNLVSGQSNTEPVTLNISQPGENISQ